MSARDEGSSVVAAGLGGENRNPEGGSPIPGTPTSKPTRHRSSTVGLADTTNTAEGVVDWMTVNGPGGDPVSARLAAQAALSGKQSKRLSKKARQLVEQECERVATPQKERLKMQAQVGGCAAVPDVNPANLELSARLSDPAKRLALGVRVTKNTLVTDSAELMRDGLITDDARAGIRTEVDRATAAEPMVWVDLSNRLCGQEARDPAPSLVEEALGEDRTLFDLGEVTTPSGFSYRLKVMRDNSVVIITPVTSQRFAVESDNSLPEQLHDEQSKAQFHTLILMLNDVHALRKQGRVWFQADKNFSDAVAAVCFYELAKKFQKHPDYNPGPAELVSVFKSVCELAGPPMAMCHVLDWMLRLTSDREARRVFLKRFDAVGLQMPQRGTRYANMEMVPELFRPDPDKVFHQPLRAIGPMIRMAIDQIAVREAELTRYLDVLTKLADTRDKLKAKVAKYKVLKAKASELAGDRDGKQERVDELEEQLAAKEAELKQAEAKLQELEQDQQFTAESMQQRAQSLQSFQGKSTELLGKLKAAQLRNAELMQQKAGIEAELACVKLQARADVTAKDLEIEHALQQVELAREQMQGDLELKVMEATEEQREEARKTQKELQKAKAEQKRAATAHENALSEKAAELEKLQGELDKQLLDHKAALATRGTEAEKLVKEKDKLRVELDTVKRSKRTQERSLVTTSHELRVAQAVRQQLTAQVAGLSQYVRATNMPQGVKIFLDVVLSVFVIPFFIGLALLIKSKGKRYLMWNKSAPDQVAPETAAGADAPQITEVSDRERELEQQLAAARDQVEALKAQVVASTGRGTTAEQTCSTPASAVSALHQPLLPSRSNTTVSASA